MGAIMQRPFNAPARTPGSASPDVPVSHPVVIARPNQQGVGTFWDMLAIRIIFVAVCGVAGYHFRPFSLSHMNGTIAGGCFALAIILVEVRLRKASLRRLIGAAVGA